MDISVQQYDYPPELHLFPPFLPADKLLHLTALLELQYGSACSVTNII